MSEGAVVKRLYKSIRDGLFRVESTTSLLRRNLLSSRTILDVGCGKDSPLQYVPRTSEHRIGLDIQLQWLVESKRKHIHDSYLLADARNLPIRQKAIDSVVITDVIEHLEKKDALNLLDQLEKTSHSKLMLTTVNNEKKLGNLSEIPRGGDIWWQTHKSRWTPEEFIKRGYKVQAYSSLNFWRTWPLKFIRAIPQDKTMGKLLTLVLNLSADLAQMLLRNPTSISALLFCSKDLSTE